MRANLLSGWLERLQLRAEYGSWAMVSLAVTMCVVLALALLVLPLAGLKLFALAAVVLIIGIWLICYLIFVPGATRRA